MSLGDRTEKVGERVQERQVVHMQMGATPLIREVRSAQAERSQIQQMAVHTSDHH